MGKSYRWTFFSLSLVHCTPILLGISPLQAKQKRRQKKQQPAPEKDCVSQTGLTYYKDVLHVVRLVPNLDRFRREAPGDAGVHDTSP